jgi:hypothetical protein
MSNQNAAANYLSHKNLLYSLLYTRMIPNSLHTTADTPACIDNK